MFPLTVVHLKTPQNLIGWDVKPNQNPCERPQTDALLPRNSSFGLSRVSGAVSGRTQTDKNSQKSSSQPWRRCQSLRGCCKGKCAHTRASSCVKKQLRSQTYKKHQNVAPSARIARCNIPFPDALTKRRRQPVIETVAKSAVEKNQQTFLSFVEETQMAQCGFYRLSQQQQQKESPQNIPLCVTTLFWVLVNFGKLRYPPPLPHFNTCFCEPGFAIRFIVLHFLNFPGYLWAGISLSAHLRALSFTLHLRTAWTQLPVEQRAPGALRLGRLQALQGLERNEPKKSAVVVALMMR